METIFIIILVALFVLAISDLIVGVSNDAVNFLNSAIGAKAAPFKVIISIAALGVLIGATFSSGLMEVARKGIMNPGAFYFSEIMIIFLAVMITDVILLDTFNTFGLPTSTTVSIVFELLGASVAIAILKIYHSDGNSAELNTYINSGKALAIISGILLSVVVAFVCGAIVQFIARLIFSFKYQKKMKYYGAIWGGLAITAITYFMIIKGAKGASFMTGSAKDFLMNHSNWILLISFIFWTVILQLLNLAFKFNILKFIVLVGTFALAMAFAGNDLVNFVGVPLAGLASFDFFSNSPGADPNLFLMTELAGKVKTPTYLLLIAGLVMVLTLYFSKKAKSVVKTSLDLSRQDEGPERFGSTVVSRAIVKSSMHVYNTVKIIIPKRIQKKLANQFQSSTESSSANTGAFDMLRASVNLVVASILISFATSLKLPLSTTYVTFMVAMGTSLSDRAWGRESAVYRVTGVISVISGWFITAFVAFTVAFIVAAIFYFGGITAMIILMVIALLVVIRTHTIHKSRMKKEAELAKVESEQNITQKCQDNISVALGMIINIQGEALNGVIKEKFKLLKKAKKDTIALNVYSKRLKDQVHKTVAKLQADENEEAGLHYIQVLDYLRETAHSLTHIVIPCFNHIDNNHKPFIEEQIEEINRLRSAISRLLVMIKNAVDSNNFDNSDELIELRQNCIDMIKSYQKNQIKRIKKNTASTKNSLLFLSVLDEQKHLLLHIFNLYKAQRDFMNQETKTNE
ncbi:MAG: inorganic phosphate transporter [Bacteroidales bacterium]